MSTITEAEVVVKKPRKHHKIEIPQWNLGVYIQAFIDEKGWSRRKFAKYADISHPYMNVIIRGIDTNTGCPPTISVEKMDKLAKALNTTVDALVPRMHVQGVESPQISSEKKTNKYEFFVRHFAQRMRELYPVQTVRKAKLHDLLQTAAFDALLEPDLIDAFPQN